ncbi:MAG: diacylglycerol kinase family lipid kinase [Sphingobacteriia bacterium]|jgi:diacylglycerol kinase (ATP)|nr:diacylglycerol kinase family lipid kinase [Sphingobacteriia bacterium]
MINIKEEMWGVIVNPHSGKKRLGRDWSHVYALFKEANIKFTAQLTAYPGHAIEIAKNMVDNGYKHFFIVGGDGTLDEVVNGIYQAEIPDKSDITIALIPLGTGNDWARFWGITKDNYKAISGKLLIRKRQPVDLGKISYIRNNEIQTEYFVNQAGIGFDGLVIKLTNKYKRFLGGNAWAYSLSILMSVFMYKSTLMQVYDDSKRIFEHIFSIAIGNGCYSGGGLKQTPDAIPTDGLFHVSVIKKPTFLQIIKGLKYLFKEEITKLNFVETFVCSKITIESPEKVFSEKDGLMIPGQGPFTAEIVHNGIKMLIL